MKHDKPGELRGFAVLAAGRYGGRDFSESTLDRIVAAFHALEKWPALTPCLKIGHDAAQKFAQADGLPNLGTITNLYRQGPMLLADAKDVAPVAVDLIKAGRYRMTSAEIVMHEDSYAYRQGVGRDVRGPRLRAVALLADLPACASLTELRAALVDPVPPPVVEDDQVIACALAPAREEPMMKTNTRTDTLDARLLEMSETVAALKRNNANLGARLDKLNANEDRAIKASSFDPQVAGAVGYDAYSFLAEVESELQSRGVSREDVEARRGAARAVLLRWQQTHPTAIPSADDYARIINGSAPATTTKPAPPTVMNPSRDPSIPARARLGSPVVLTERQALPVYGWAQLEAVRLGGGDLGEGSWRFHRLRTIARNAGGLRLSNPGEREIAERLLFDEIAAPVAQCRSWEEGIRALARGEGKVMLSEQDTRNLALRLMELRPDLRDHYGRDEAPPPARRPTNPDEATKELDRQALLLLKEQDACPSSINVARARSVILKDHPELAPAGQYGWRKD